MMNPAKSRYFAISKTVTGARELKYRGERVDEAPGSRQPIAYQRRRFLPQGAKDASLTERVVADGDRLDLLAYQIYGDAEQWWRLADANDAMDPAELTRTPGRTLRVPLPQFQADVPEDGGADE